jgi:hypothetical protein
MAIDGVALGAVAVGSVFAYAGVKGISIPEAIQAVVQGKSPVTLPNRYPISHEVATGLVGAAGAIAGASGNAIVDMARQIQATGAGQAGYCWGGGHTSNPCGAKCYDCSGYVSCVLNRLGVLKGSMTTNGFLAWSGASTVAFANRQAGDIAVNTKHMGIVLDSSTMIAARCTACGRPGVQTQTLTSAYKIRRVKGSGSTGQTEQQARTPSGRATTAGL